MTICQNTLVTHIKTNFSHNSSNYQKIILKFNYQFRLPPVSYTHLDVYKRQGVHYIKFNCLVSLGGDVCWCNGLIVHFA